MLTNKTVLSREIIERLPRLRYIGVLATGYNIVDMAAARERNIPVTNVPDYATLSVVQMVFAHLLNLTLHVAEHGQGVAARPLDAKPRFRLLGLSAGRIGGVDASVWSASGGSAGPTAKVALALGMNVLAYDAPRHRRTDILVCL